MTFLETPAPKYFSNTKESLAENIKAFVDYIGDFYNLTKAVNVEKTNIALEIATDNYCFNVYTIAPLHKDIAKVFFIYKVNETSHTLELDIFNKTSDEIKSACDEFRKHIDEAIIQTSNKEAIDTMDTNVNQESEINLIKDSLFKMGLLHQLVEIKLIDTNKYLTRTVCRWCEEAIFKLNKNSNRVKEMSVVINRSNKEKVVFKNPDFTKITSFLKALVDHTKNISDRQLAENIVIRDYFTYSYIINCLGISGLHQDQLKQAVECYDFKENTPVSKLNVDFLVNCNGQEKVGSINFCTINQSLQRFISARMCIDGSPGVIVNGNCDEVINELSAFLKTNNFNLNTFNIGIVGGWEDDSNVKSN